MNGRAHGKNGINNLKAENTSVMKLVDKLLNPRGNQNIKEEDHNENIKIEFEETKQNGEKDLGEDESVSEEFEVVEPASKNVGKCGSNPEMKQIPLSDYLRGRVQNQVLEQKEVKETDSHEAGQHQARSAAVVHQNLEESAQRKEYTAYEDWRLIEAMHLFIQRKGASGLKSIKTWETMRDPKTGNRLLNGDRTAESMRNRIKRTLDVLEDGDVEKIREYMRTHSEEEARKHYCRFEKNKWSGQKEFKGIFPELNYNPQTLTKKNNTDINTSTPRVKEPSKRNMGSVQKEFEKDLLDDIEPVDLNKSAFDSKVQRLIEHPKEFSNSRVISNTNIVKTPDKPASLDDEEKLYVFEEEGKTTAFKVMQYQAKIKKISREVNPIEVLAPDEDSSIQSLVREDSGRVSKKRKDYENKELNLEDECELKKVKQSEYFERQSLTVSDTFKSRKFSELNASLKDDLMILLDLTEESRQFVNLTKEESEDEYQNIYVKTE